MKLSRITRLSYRAVSVDGFEHGRVYPAESLSRYSAAEMSHESAGETPSNTLPATLSEIPDFCDRWISFLRSSLAADLGAPADIARPLLRGLHDAVQGMLDRPALPDGLRKLPEVWCSKLNDVAEVLRTYRDWAKSQLLPAHNLSPVSATSCLQLPTPHEPSPPRLAVDLARKTITLDGMPNDIPSDLALRWVKVLVEHPGEWISSTELKDHDRELDGCRPDRLKKYLPPAILLLIDSNRRKGSRLRLAK